MAGQVSLRHKLVLFKQILNYFGVSDILGLRETLKREKETFDADGKSYYFNALKGLTLRIDEDTLSRYDGNIKAYLNYINRLRSEKINLKYFQYLAVLFTEIFLDNLFNRNGEFLKELNDFVEKENRENSKEYPKFSKNDLSKIAYWMATGSGKTLIMHINWLQFHKYNKKSIDNILLITPNESLSKQHFDELRKSNIPVKIFNGSNAQKDTIQIIEIHKLTEEKKGEGVSVEVSAFEGNNLVFVDEGHKGFSGKAWKSLRDKISEIGFTFEYSATFDEAISSKKDELMEEYSKAIIIDYSYRYFYYDGFGKEFTVLNLKNTEYEKHKELILLTNLLSFYQQLKFYEDNKQKMGDFSFEKPLWIFVGNSVSSGNKDKFDADTLSDLQFVVTFLNKFLNNKEDEFIKKIDDIIHDNISLKGKEEDIKFTKLLSYIKDKTIKAKGLYEDILNTIFNSESSGKLELFNISNASGEVGLKVSTAKKYFALVYIGDISSFKKKLEEKHDLIFQDDKFADSFFNTINDEDSPINVLMGSKKFIEGWNSFRVSTMGLLNMGRSKGSQIIQLFGRGVRLKGYKNLMKRTKMLIEEKTLEKEDIRLNLSYLETLYIFGIKADYIDTFKRQLEEEGIAEEEVLNLEIKKSLDFLKKNLTLDYFSSISPVRIDLRPKFEMFESSQREISKTKIEEMTVPLYDYLDYFNWEKIYFELYNFKQQKEFYNLYFNKEILIKIMKKNNYKVLFDKTFNIDTFNQFEFVESLCLRVLQKYVTEFYNIHKRKWATDNLEYGVLSNEDENFQDYKIIIDKTETTLIKDIKKLITEANKIYEEDRKELPSIVFDRHLYQPLIIKSKKIITIPTGLNEGEEKLVKDLRTYFLRNKDKEIIKKMEFYVFRNLSKKGVGFFAETNNFYPDFILWVIDDKKQKIAFIDPKGLIHGPAQIKAKIEVKNTLKDIESKLRRKDIELTSFIVAGENSTFSKIKGLAGINTKAEFENNHVVFQEDRDYVDKIISKVIS